MTHRTLSRRTSTFAVVWLGQFVSLLGSGLTSFAIGVWVFEHTASITQFSLMGLCAVLPRVVLSPLAGTLVDRWDRRWAMILSDVGAGLSTLAIVLLLLFDRLEVWHVYLAVATGAACGTVQWLAYTAVTSLLVPRENLGRANGMVQFGQAVSDILAPALAGFLTAAIRLEGVILIDVATFVFAVGTLLLVRFPRPKSVVAGRTEKAPLWSGMSSGWKYVAARRGLLGLLVFVALTRFLWGMVGALVTPMILSFAPSEVLGAIISTAGGGMLVGSLVMSVWGGPRRRVDGVLYFELLSGVCFLLMGLRPAFWLIGVGAFGAHLTIAIIYGSNQAIWQSKVAPDVQGRVFAVQEMVARAASPLAYLLAGPLADKVFEPLLAPGGPLASGVGQVVGVGAGRGIGLIFVVMGMLKIAVALAGQLDPHIRHVEDELPDAVARQPDPSAA